MTAKLERIQRTIQQFQGQTLIPHKECKLQQAMNQQQIYNLSTDRSRSHQGSKYILTVKYLPDPAAIKNT